MLHEEWRPIPGYGSYYEASSLGRIRSVDREVNGYSARGKRPIKIRRKGHVMALDENWAGYKVVGLYVDGRQTRVSVHLLVLAAFIGPRPLGMEGCHGLKGVGDNSVGNLRWDTPEANLADIELHGNRHRGERVVTSKLTTEQVLEIRNGMGPAEATRRFGIGRTTFYRIKRGESWAHVTADPVPQGYEELARGAA